MLTQIEVDKRMTAYLGCPEGVPKGPQSSIFTNDMAS